MVRIARQRVSDLFGLAEREARGPHPELADRYVALARRIGMRYNLRLIGSYRDLYCRACSTYWIEGRTVRTRLRGGRRVRTCLRCGHQRRIRSRPSSRRPGAPPARETRDLAREEGTLWEPAEDDDFLVGPETEDE